MALLFLDGFDHYNSQNEKWPLGGVNGPAFVTGRFGVGQSFSPTNNGILRRKIDPVASTYYDTIIMGCAFQEPSSSQGYPIRNVIGAWRDGSEYWHVGWLSTNRFAVYRAGVWQGEETVTRQKGVWYYVEFKVTCSTGAWVLRVGGVQVASGTGSATASVNEIALQNGVGGSYNANGYRDDLYVCDNSGSVNNDFMGDIRVETLYPNGNGNSSVFVGSDGNSTDNYLLVDESDADDDSTYVAAPTVGDKDTYAYGNLATASGTVKGVQINCRARKTDAGSRSIVTVARESATEADSASRSLADTYTYLAEDVRETKPSGGAWSISDVNAAEFGVKVSA